MAYLQHAHHRAFRYPGLNVRANERNEARFNFRVQPNLDKIKPRALVMSCLQHDLPTRHHRIVCLTDMGTQNATGPLR